MEFWYEFAKFPDTRYQNDISTPSFYCEFLLKPMISIKKRKNPLKKEFSGCFKRTFWEVLLFQAAEIIHFSVPILSVKSALHTEILFVQKWQVCRLNKGNNTWKRRDSHIARVREVPRLLFASRIFVHKIWPFAEFSSRY